jgi:hypothetical protein
MRSAVRSPRMRRRPIVYHGEGRYLPAAVDSLFYGLA